MIGWLRRLMSRPAPVAPVPAPIVPPVPFTPYAPTDAEQAVVIAFLKRPDRPARREAVLRALEARLEHLLQPMGFRRKGKLWLREMPAGLATVRIQRFMQGQDATLVVEFEPKPGTLPLLIRADSLSMQLPNFVPMAERSFVNNGSIDYAFADHDPGVMDVPLAVLRHRALPWLLDHADGQYPDWKTYRDRPLT